MSRRRKEIGPGADIAAKLKLVPAAPGVYLHKDARGRVVYVGKAKRLNQRLRSYFQSGAERDEKTAELVRSIADFDYIATDSEAAALILENQLIKEYKPRFNVRLKDDKQYPYLRISTQEPFPRVTVVRRLETDGARYFGPYTDVRSLRDTLRFATGFFQVRTCALDLPDPTIERPCLDYQIGRCGAPCTAYEAEATYRRKVGQLIAFLEGHDRRIVAELQAEMAERAEELRYEEAGRLRDRIARLERTVRRSEAGVGFQSDADVCGIARDGADACGVVLRLREGRILTTHHFQLRDRLERETEVFVAQLLREYYSRAGEIGPEVLLSHPVTDVESWEHWLGHLRGRRVRIRTPRRGAKRRVVNLAAANAAFKLGERTLGPAAGGRAVTPVAVQLQDALDLRAVPETVECFDISNFQGREAVGSLVFFRGGEPLKSRYRRFRVRLETRGDDYASLAEVLDRYYGRLAERGEQAADLVIIDGGAGQVSTAQRILARHGFGQAQLIGLAKREETVHRDGAQIHLPRTSPALKLLQRIRDEAHRFAITYHRLLRDRRTRASALDRVPGIGEVKKLALLYHFGSVARIATASAAELAEVRGINQRDVVNILNFFAVHDTDAAEAAARGRAAVPGAGTGGNRD